MTIALEYAQIANNTISKYIIMSMIKYKDNVLNSKDI